MFNIYDTTQSFHLPFRVSIKLMKNKPIIDLCSTYLFHITFETINGFVLTEPTFLLELKKHAKVVFQ